MLKIFEKVICFVLFKSSEANFLLDIVDAVAPEHKCILPNTWTAWMDQGTCEKVTRIRRYKYYKCEYDI